MRKTALNLLSVIGGEMLLRGANFAAVVLVARLYGASMLGTYATVLAVVSLAVMIADNGLQVSSITEIARNPSELGATLGQMYVIKTLLFVVMISILAAIGVWTNDSTLTWIMGGFLTIRTVLYSYCQLHGGVLKALDHMPAIGMIQTIHCVCLLMGIGLALRYSWNVYALLAWLLVCQAIELVLSGSLLFQYKARPRWASLSGCWRVLYHSTPVGITYSTAALILRADVLVLASLASTKEVGIFAAADIPLVMVYIVAWLLGGVVLPRMVGLSSNPPGLEAYVRGWIRLLMLTAIPACLVLAWVAPQLTRMLYGAQYASSGTLAAIMVLAVPFILMNSVYLSRAVASDSKSVFVGVYVGTAVLSVGLDRYLGQQLGSTGIAVAIVAREVAMFVAFALLGTRRLNQRSADRTSVLIPSIIHTTRASE